jgi:hypothetical protein
MFKTLTAGGMALLAALVINPNSSQAGTDLDVTSGAAAYPVHYYPDYRVYPGYPYYYDYEYISCAEARQVVRAHGFNRVKVLRCGGEIYKYQALRRYRPWIIRVSARSGRIISARPLPGYY